MNKKTPDSPITLNQPEILKSLVSDLQLDRKTDQDAAFRLNLTNLNQYHIIALEPALTTAYFATLSLSNKYNFTLSQTEGYMVDGDHKICDYEHTVNVNFKVTVTQDNHGLKFDVKMKSVQLSEYFMKNGYKVALIDKLQEDLESSYD